MSQAQQTAGPRTLRQGLQLVHLLAAPRRATGHDQATHARPVRNRAHRDREIETGEHRRVVGQAEFVPQVGAIAAVEFHRIAIAHAIEVRRDAVAGFGPQRADKVFGERQNVLALDERRLNIDLCKFRLTIGPQIFIAETACDLEVAVEAAAHEQLLVDLRRLGQRVELARMYTARHQIIARPLRRRLRENRSLEFEIPPIAEKPARDLQ